MIELSNFGVLPDGTAVKQYTLRAVSGMSVKVIEYGAALISINVPDRDGALGEILLGYDNLSGYQNDSYYMGAMVGRYANRIANGRFSLNGQNYKLSANNNSHTLHGGSVGFNKHQWLGSIISDGATASVRFERTSPDGEEGFPGNLSTSITYSLREETFSASIRATTDAPTVVNLTLHPYFNLSGTENQMVDHKIAIHATKYLPIDEMGIPTGEIADVAGSPFDLRNSSELRKYIYDTHPQVVTASGFDHSWVIEPSDHDLRSAATLEEPVSGRTLEVLTTAPGLHFYSGNFLGSSASDGKFSYRQGLCLEPQDFPDAPNKSNFPSTVLKPGETYVHDIEYRFGVKS